MQDSPIYLPAVRSKHPQLEAPSMKRQQLQPWTIRPIREPPESGHDHGGGPAVSVQPPGFLSLLKIPQKRYEEAGPGVRGTHGVLLVPVGDVGPGLVP